MQARNAGTLRLLNRSGNGKGIFGPTWGCQILRLRTSNANRLQTNITSGFCQFHYTVSLTADSTTASKFEFIIVDAPILHKVSEVLGEISCQKYSRGESLDAINIYFALNIHCASASAPTRNHLITARSLLMPFKSNEKYKGTKPYSLPFVFFSLSGSCGISSCCQSGKTARY
jgi:hypothetical protein